MSVQLVLLHEDLAANAALERLVVRQMTVAVGIQVGEKSELLATDIAHERLCMGEMCFLVTMQMGETREAFVAL